MFGSGFALGFDVSDLQTGISNFIGLAPVTALIVGVLVLMFVPRIIRTLRSTLGRR